MDPRTKKRVRKTSGPGRTLALAVGLLAMAFAVYAGLRYGPILKARVMAGRSSMQIPVERVEAVEVVFPKGERLETASREVPRSRDAVDLGEAILRSLIQGPGEGMDRVFAPGAELRALFIDKAGMVFIDLDRQAFSLPKDAFGESLAIQSVYESLKRNIPEVTGIRFLVDSKETDTLWGHFDALKAWTDGR